MNSHKTKSKKYSPNKASVLVRDIFFLMIGTIVTVIIVQVIVGKLMILMIGREAFVETVPTAIFFGSNLCYSDGDTYMVAA